MFQLYKYKRIFVFLLTFFLLTNGFSSFEEEYSDEGSFSSSQENSSQENIDEMPSLSAINQSHRRTLESFGFFNLNNEIIKSTDDLPLEKNNSHIKRKISIEETNEAQEEQIDEEKNQKTAKINKKNTKWTPEMKIRLMELKTLIDPDTEKNYTHPKIAKIMSQEFSPWTFNERTIGARWQIIGKKKIKKNIKWTDEMIDYLKKLKNEKKLIPSIVKNMTKEFPNMKFTEASVTCKWQRIKENEE